MHQTQSDIIDVIVAHAHCTRNRDGIKKSTRCGCFYCLAQFDPADVDEWVDGGKTALCPACGIDAVIGDADCPLSLEFLIGMREHWFGTPGRPLGEQYILGANRFDTFSKVRYAARALIVRDGMILMTHEQKDDLYMIPGGGLEKGETFEDCCAREVREETGFVVRPVREVTVINEFYEEYRFVSHYFLCEVTGQAETALTDGERARGLRPEWLPLDRCLDILSRHADYDGVNEEKRGIYQREYMALTTYAKSVGKDA